MKRREHPLIVATIENLARSSGIDPQDMWAYLDRRKAPSKKLRDAFVAAFFPRVPPESFLPSPEDNSTIRTMREEILEPRMGRPLKAGKLAAALVKAGVTLAEIAAAAKRSTASVRSWSYPLSDDSHRPAPRQVVEMFQDKYGIPLSVWPEIVG